MPKAVVTYPATPSADTKAGTVVMLTIGGTFMTVTGHHAEQPWLEVIWLDEDKKPVTICAPYACFRIQASPK